MKSTTMTTRKSLRHQHRCEGLNGKQLESAYDNGEMSDGHPIHAIRDRWISNKGRHIGYIIEYKGYEGQTYAVRTDDMDAQSLIAGFENINRNKQGNRKGAVTTDASPMPFGSCDVAGEFSHLCEGYTSESCALIALNVHFKRRLYESFDDFKKDLPDSYKDKKAIDF